MNKFWFGGGLVFHNLTVVERQINSKKVCKDQELKQSEPKSSPQDQNGK